MDLHKTLIKFRPSSQPIYTKVLIDLYAKDLKLYYCLHVLMMNVFGHLFQAAPKEPPSKSAAGPKQDQKGFDISFNISRYMYCAHLQLQDLKKKS